MLEGRKETVLQIMRDADLIFAQRTSEDFFLRWLTPNSLRSTLGSKCFIWPNIYFDGYFPKTGYIYKAGIGKLQSPLEDYHLAPLVDAHRRGLDAVAATREFELFKAGGASSFEASFAELEQRERDSDVPISDFLRAEAPRRRVVYTPNHPYNHVLAEMGCRLALRAQIGYDVGIATGINYRLERIYLPAFPSIVESLSLPFDAETHYRGVEITEVSKDRIVLGAERGYSVRELVDAFWAIYEKFPP